MSSDRRRKGFKKGIDTEDARRKREDNIVELRKNKRDENLQKKRAVFGAPGAATMEDSTRGTASFQRKVGMPCPISAYSPGCLPVIFGVTGPDCACSWRACPSWCAACTARIRNSS
jgi:hypothetical protein